MESLSFTISNSNRPLVFPVLLLARRAIEEAFESAKKKFQDGELSEDALDAILWLEASTDWTRMKLADGSAPVPPREIRAEFPFTFDWCCRLLCADPEVVRKVGLPTTRLFNENPTVGGLAAIYQYWAEQRSAWLAKQESGANLETPLPSTCRCGKEVPEYRLRRGSHCCSKECHDADRSRKALARIRAQEAKHTPEVPLPPICAPEPLGATDFS